MWMLRENKLQHRKSAFLEEITISNFALQSKKKKKKKVKVSVPHTCYTRITQNRGFSWYACWRATHSQRALSFFFPWQHWLARWRLQSEKRQKKKKKHTNDVVSWCWLPSYPRACMHARTHVRTRWTADSKVPVIKKEDKADIQLGEKSQMIGN